MMSRFIASDYHDLDAVQSIPLANLLSHRIIVQCAVVCVKVAIEAIETIYTERSSDPGGVGYLAAVS